VLHKDTGSEGSLNETSVRVVHHGLYCSCSSKSRTS